MAGFGRILRPTAGGNAPRAINNSEHRKAYRFIRPPGAVGGGNDPGLYVGYSGNSRLFKFNRSTGTYRVISNGVLSGVRSISCHPLTQMIYVAGGVGDVTCLRPSGSVVWSVELGSGGQISDLCISNENELYVAFRSGKIFKLNGETGEEITDGWPYTLSGMRFNCVCVARSGNVYAGGENDARVVGENNPGVVRLLSLTSAGSLRWTNPIFHFSEIFIEDTEVYSLAVAGDESSLTLTRGTTNDFNLAFAFVDSSDGIPYGGLSGPGPYGDACDYSVLHEPYIGQSDIGGTGNTSGVIRRFANDLLGGSTKWSQDPSLLDTLGDQKIRGLVATRDGRAYAIADPGPSGNNVFAIAGGGFDYEENTVNPLDPPIVLWRQQVTETADLTAIEDSSGRIGAFE